MENIHPGSIAEKFNECINNRDIDSLIELMTDDHTFIDSAENHISGKKNCKKTWTGFFNAFPDYQNIFEIINSTGNLVVIQGYSRCSDKRLEGKAIWTAKIVDNKISEWRVYEATEDNKAKLDLS